MCTSSNRQETILSSLEKERYSWAETVAANNTKDTEGDQHIQVKFLDANIILLIAFLVCTPNTVLFMSTLTVCVALSEILEEL